MMISVNLISVNFTDKNGESCWADFSSAQAAVEYCGIENILSWEHYEEPLGYDEYDEYDGQPDEAQEWYDYDPDC
jgi:hypothetical protein